MPSPMKKPPNAADCRKTNTYWNAVYPAL